MSTLAWIIGSSLLMSAIAMVGSITLIFKGLRGFMWVDIGISR